MAEDEAKAGPVPTAAPFGSWDSTLDAAALAAGTVRFGQLSIAEDRIFWSEGRPSEGGRTTIVECAADARAVDRLPPPYDARSRVHEYGGGAWVVGPGRGEIVFSHDADQRLWRLREGVAEPLTRTTNRRYADAALDAARGRLVAVCEEHGTAGTEARNFLVAVDLASGAETTLAEGHDFFSNPRLAPDGTRLCWLSWDHPRMPWDGSELWVAELAADGTPAAPRRVAGGPTESIFQPEWSPAGELHFVSDRSGWWNLFRERGGDVQALHPMAAEFGVAQWAFGMTTYGFEPGGTIVCSFVRTGRWHLARLDPESGSLAEIGTGFTTIAGLQVGHGFAAFAGASPTEAASIVRIDLATGATTVLRRSSAIALAADAISVAEPIVFPTDGGLDAHAFFYPPTNPRFTGPAGEKPPLLVLSHGGPTGCTDAGLRLALQYWTSRGFAVVDVDYGGSSGHGRAYRERLNGQWGVVDVDDVVNAARFLVERGDVDGERLAIRGASAGGYTTLAALTFRDVFRAGASHYGISDLEALARDTHKFESRYLDGLIGPYPERADLYRARSPLHATDRLSSALILFQGAEDKAVPPDQAEAMMRAVLAKGLPVAYLLFEGEQHGFRRAENIRRALEAELWFYGRIFGFTPAGDIDPVDLRNPPAIR